MEKRGQSALEFLMTYGWAFLVILVMIGALGYYGILSPTKFIPEKCIFGSKLSCEAHAGDTPGEILKLKNNLPERINITNVKFSNENTDGYKGCYGWGWCVQKVIPSDSTVETPCLIANDDWKHDKSRIGEKVKTKYKITYYTDSPEFEKVIKGETYTTLNKEGWHRVDWWWNARQDNGC